MAGGFLISRAGELLKKLALAEESKGGDLKSASKRAASFEPSPYASALYNMRMSRQLASALQTANSFPGIDDRKKPPRPS